MSKEMAQAATRPPLVRFIRRAGAAVLSRLFPQRFKAYCELKYWKSKAAEEGRLGNSHYEAFFTKNIGISPDFYSGKRVLDIGCGPRGSLEWADMASERVGLDPLANEYLKLGADKHKMRYVDSGSESMPFKDGHFDVVTSFNSLDHVANLEQTIAEIVRVTKPGGTFILLTDVGHKPTPCEPVELNWNVMDTFKKSFEIVEERHFERNPTNIYDSVLEGVPYNHEDQTERYGLLFARLVRKSSGP